MKKSLLKRMMYPAAAIALTVAMVSCGGGKNPDVAPGNSFTEADDAGNGEKEEATGLVVNGTDWIQVGGTFANSEDVDMFEIKVDQSVFKDDTTKYKIEMAFISEGEPLGMLMRMGFPLSAVSYEGDKVKMNYLLVGAAGSISVDPGVDRVRLRVSGSANKENPEKSIYSNGKSYAIKMK